MPPQPDQPHLPEIAPQPERFTRVPDAVLDRYLATLGLAELRVWLYIVRRSVGFGQPSARISLEQFARGAINAVGEPLDGGTGLSKRAICYALNSLERQGLIRRRRHSSRAAGQLATEYQPVTPAGAVRYPGMGTSVHMPLTTSMHRPLATEDHQDRKTDGNTEQKTDRFSIRTPATTEPESEELANLRAFLEHCAEELHDNAPPSSTASRGIALMRSLGIDDPHRFQELARQALLTTRPRNKGVPYFFAVLKNLAGADAERQEQLHNPRDLAGRYAHLIKR